MMRIHWFNPENDVALANGTATYTPPRAALRLQKAGSALPLWYADGGDQVLCYGVPREWLRQIREDFGLDIALFNHQPTAAQMPEPWGWSAYTKRYFQDEGFDIDTLPSDHAINRMRELSHRRTAAAIAQELQEALPHIPMSAAAYEATTMEEVKMWLNSHPKAYLKQPWSSSGRGVLDVNAISREAMLKMADDSIRRQGSVMLETAYDRAIDFARLYQCIDGKCYDIGTSVFHVDHRGGYTGNVLATESRRLQMVGQHYDVDTLQEVAESLRSIIEKRIAPYYQGVLGVDMLVDRTGLLDAVVEINLRKTMGYVANRFAELHMSEGSEGTFSIVHTSGVKLIDDYEIEDHRIACGELSLTPSSSDFAFKVDVHRVD